MDFDKSLLKERGLIWNGYHLPYNPNNIEKAKFLRKNMTYAEKYFVENVLKSHFSTFSFLIQRPIDHYIIDFYCASLRLAIEIDGEIHNETVEYDNQRTELLDYYDVKVHRFTNDEVIYNTKEVRIKLKSIIDELVILKSNPDPPSPLKKGVPD
ncbi:MAG: endonuclease domain-containing protein [Bacteroidota bacterium]|nr:endonuclease domain-containing protein [Bacteroidota bacterium]